MANRTIIPFGPQHPVLPEPIHLDLVVEDEKVIEAIPSIGFIHRGLEKLVEKRDFIDFTYVAERICGICSFIHGQTYCQGIEEIMKIEVPSRAKALRTIWGEMSRLHSHLLWLGLMADAFGFEALFMHCWRLREKLLDVIEETTGGRVIFGSCKVGGTRRDVTDAKLAEIVKLLNGMEQEIRDITGVFISDSTVKHRMRGVGIITKDEAIALGSVGPTLRGSGVAQDMRTLGYAFFDKIKVNPITRPEGDCQARCEVRIDELFQSMDIIRQVVTQMPAGPVDVEVKGTPNGEFFSRVEQPRGEVVYYIKANGTKNLQRFRARTPTFSNLAPLIKMLQGCDLADVPVMALTIDPCISCTER